MLTFSNKIFSSLYWKLYLIPLLAIWFTAFSTYVLVTTLFGVEGKVISLLPDYTAALFLFLGPCCLTLLFLLRRHLSSVQWIAFFTTNILGSALGCLVDIVLGDVFLTFPNPDAILKVYLPGLTSNGWQWYIPVEEFLFYYFGNLFILSSYLYFKSRYQPSQTLEEQDRLKFKDFRLYLPGAALCFALLIGAYWYTDGALHQPLYFSFIVFGTYSTFAFTGSLLKRQLSFKTIVFTTLALIPLSIAWEAVLGIPKGWWGYKDNTMLGIYFDIWPGLPLEAILFWFAAVIQIVCIYEGLKALFVNVSFLRNHIEFTKYQ